MKKEKQINLLLIAGLLLVSGGNLLNRFTEVPDFVIGLCFGAGIGLEILFLIKRRKAGCSTL